MPDANFARGHTDPTTMPPWMYEEVALELGGYMAAAYLAGVEVGRADERARVAAWLREPRNDGGSIGRHSAAILVQHGVPDCRDEEPVPVGSGADPATTTEEGL